MHKFKLVLLLISISSFVFSQRGKDGNYTVSSANDIVNTYTSLTANAGATATILSVANNSMTGAHFSGPLQAGDLIMIYEVQGIWVDINTYTVTGWSGDYTVQNSFFGNGNIRSFIEFGSVNNYKNVGKYEYAEVLSVSGTNTIRVTCPLKNSYEIGTNHRAQIIRVPRFENLTVPNATSIITPKWNGTIGGVVAIEVEENLSIIGTGRISADESGFRGGISPNIDNAAGGPGSISDIASRGHLGSSNALEGSEKGESIFGNVVDYNVLYSRYGYGSIANGGGGGGYHNAGGGGGSNVGVGAYYGYGIVDRGTGNVYDPAWILENPIMHTTPSAGGGRGGYSHATNNRNPLTVGPHNNLWGSDYRRIAGGVGGHPLLYDQTRAFMGGGGGAGHGNNTYGGTGGAGGGIVFISVYGNVTGNGIISANGEDGGNAEGTQPGPFSSAKTGDDGAGGAGGGMEVIINNIITLPATLQLEAKGGKGGDQILKFGGFNNDNQADAPGGGGAGGMIAYSLGTLSQDVTGGVAGTTNSSFMTTFPVNGATGGASGMASQITYTLDILVDNDTICRGETSTLTASKVGNLSPSPGLLWYNNYTGGAAIASGNTYTTPALTTTTTYYVGMCPNSFRVPVTVVVAPDIVFTGTPPTISPETCAGNDGSITGITATGGFGNLTYEWNGNVSPSEDLTGATGGSYTLTVSDEVGCNASVGPFVISNVGGPVADITAMVITDESCIGNDGSITGITVSGGTTPYTYAWNGNASVGTDLTGANGGSYTLVITDDNLCSTTVGPFTIASPSAIVIDASGIAITDESCTGNDGSITGITASGGTGTLTYAWAPSAATTLDLTGATNGSYTLTVTDGAGCSETSGPHVINQISGPTFDDASVLVTDASCGLNNGSISGITASGTGLTYAWSPSGATTLNPSGLAAGAHTLVITDGGGCTVSAGPYTVNAAPSPVLDASGVLVADETCAGNDGGITGITVTGGSGTLTYDWNGNASPSIDLANAVGGTYTLTVTDGNGCTASAGPFTITSPVFPTVDITTPDQLIDEGESVNIQTTFTPLNSTLSWNPTDDLNCTNCPNPIATPSESTLYIVTAISIDGCMSQDSIYITIEEPCGKIQLPTVFSPNGDGLNDQFCVLGNCIFSMRFQIFNRWGEKVFESVDLNDCWDGTFKGEPVNTGVYVYKLIVVKDDGSEFQTSGNVNLLR